METFDPSSISQFDLNGDEESFNQSDKVLDYSHIRLVLSNFSKIRKNYFEKVDIPNPYLGSSTNQKIRHQ